LCIVSDLSFSSTSHCIICDAQSGQISPEVVNRGASAAVPRIPAGTRTRTRFPWAAESGLLGRGVGARGADLPPETGLDGEDVDEVNHSLLQKLLSPPPRPRASRTVRPPRAAPAAPLPAFV
jgi:hypothetical protein